ncbi:hypothetical protein [Rossellomorea marisflavi]|uniref:hypothetical protein n=1 Tax=Rossellomorea marisflavi TaxID=189381 RepID=UPI00345CA5AE
MFKYELGSTAYYLKNNRIHSATIFSRSIIENSKEDYGENFTPFGKAGIEYATCHGVFDEKNVFSSKEKLVENLLK